MKLTKNNLDQLIQKMLLEYNSALIETPTTEMVRPLEQGSLSKNDREGGIMKQQLFHMAQQANQLHDMLHDADNVEEWVQEKVSGAAKDLRSVFDHLIYNKTQTQKQWD